MTVAGAITRLQTGYYNSNPVSAANPGGLAADGHVVNFPAAMRDLGDVGALMQGASAGDITAALQAAGGRTGLRNWLVNGGFDLWQRGVGPASSHGAYLADRWIDYFGGSGSVTRSTDVPSTEFAYSAEVSVAGSGAVGLLQNIEEFQRLRGIPCSISTWLRGPAGGTAQLLINDGVSGSGLTITTNGSWQYTNAPVTPAAAASQVQMQLWGYSAGYYRFTGAQFERGTIATPFDRRPFAVELALAQRFFRKSYLPDTPPGTISSGGLYGTSGGTNRDSVVLIERFPAMRVAPTITLYSPSTGASGKLRDIGAGADVSAEVFDVSAQLVGIRPASGVSSITAAAPFTVHFTASAEY